MENYGRNGSQSRQGATASAVRAGERDGSLVGEKGQTRPTTLSEYRPVLPAVEDSGACGISVDRSSA